MGRDTLMRWCIRVALAAALLIALGAVGKRALAGWRVLRFTSDMVGDAEHVAALANYFVAES